MKILLTGGGTGGHTTPLIAVARQMKIIAQANNIPLNLYYMGPDDFTRKWIESEGIKFIPVISGKIRRYSSFENILDFFKLPIGIIMALWKMFFVMPEAILSKGGFGSVPAIIAGIFYRIPIIIHESDSIPGISNKFAGKFAQRIAVSFPECAQYFPDKKIAFTGTPIRFSLLEGSKESAQKSFNLKGDRKVIVILGGSQGAQSINDIILGSANDLLLKYEIIHMVGKNNFSVFSKTAEIAIKPDLMSYYHIIDFMDENKLKDAYAAADLIISRAGAASIFEIAAIAKPSIIIPLPISANDHQKENAYNYARTGAAEVIEENNLTVSILIGAISRIIENEQRKKKMSEAAKSFVRLDAAAKIAEETMKLALRH